MDMAQSENKGLPGSRPAVTLPDFNASLKTCSQLFSNRIMILSGELLADLVLSVFADVPILICSVYYSHEQMKNSVLVVDKKPAECLTLGN